MCGTRYICVALGFFAIVMVAAASGAEAEVKAIDELQSKIDRNLQSGSWSDASKVMVLAVWDDYKKAVVEQRLTTTQPAGAPGQVGRADDSVGIYRLGESKKKLEIRREEGMLVVVMEGHHIPAVMSDNTFFFTTGDVVVAKLPQLGKQKHASLEFFAIKRSADGLTLGGIAPSRAPVPMTRIAE